MKTFVSTASLCLVLLQSRHIYADVERSTSTTLLVIDREVYDVGEALPLVDTLGLSDTEIAQGVQINQGSSALREKKVWNLVNSFDNYRTSQLWESVDGKKILKKIKYMVAPIWWTEEENDVNYNIDNSQIQTTYDNNEQYYKDMSWNQMSVTVEILSQVASGISKANPTWGDVQTKATEIVSDASKVEGTDYDAISVAYWQAGAGNLANNGGWASMNGGFTWMTYPHDLEILRHEIGHNFGHDHHKKDVYEYRNTRPELQDSDSDGFDMMGGGNGYDISHFAAASKWFFNWIPDSSIIHMQPEGATDNCPTCLSTGTFTLFSFDDKDIVPTPDKKMGIHIPISAAGNTLYSYWLSYRGAGVDGKAKHGLSVHLSWLPLGGMFGAHYDSLRYDAFGDTKDKFGSFVEVNSCYYVFPNGFMKDRNIGAVEKVQPVVCVDSVDIGSSIEVTISFIDPEYPPAPSASINPQTLHLECSNTGATTSMLQLDANRYNMIHVQNSGFDGEVVLKFCLDSPENIDISSSAYFYDSYPHSAITYASQLAYGSYKSAESSAFTCCKPGSTLQVPGAKVVVLKQNINASLHFDEIEIYDIHGTNVALRGKCFSYSKRWGGDPSCLNNGLIGDGCRSHSSGQSSDEFDYCVLDKYVQIDKVIIHPLKHHAWNVKDIQLVIYAGVTGSSATAQFFGELASYRLDNVFSSHEPHEEKSITIPTNMACPNMEPNGLVSVTYKSDYGNAYVVIPPSKGSFIATANTLVEVTCNLNECLQNHYLSNGSCLKCPRNSIAPIGSSSPSSCIMCPSGYGTDHQLSNSCDILAPTTATPTTAAPTLPVPITLAPTKGKSKREKIKECKQKVAAIYREQVKELKKKRAKGVATCKKKKDQAKKKNCIQGRSNKYKKSLKAKKSVKNRDSKKCNTEFN